MIASMLAAAYGIDGLYETAMRQYDDRLTDVMLRSSAYRGIGKPPPVVHIDANFYYNRSDHALIFRQLADLGAAVQAVDHIFTGRSEAAEDRLLTQALGETGNVLLGAGFESMSNVPSPDAASSMNFPPPMPIADDSRKHPFPLHGENPTFPLPELGAASAGVGILDLPKDAGDVPRRLPLLVEWEGGLYPGLGLLAVCRYLNIPPTGIHIAPGDAVTLTPPPGAGRNLPEVLEIPLDDEGFMHLNFIGIPLDIPHISYGDLVSARQHPEKTKSLESKISGRIALISEVVEPAYRIPTRMPDRRVSSGAIHAAIIHNILSQNALKPAGALEMIFIELLLAGALMVLFVRTNPYGFALGVVFLTSAVAICAWGMLVLFSHTLHLMRPLIFLGLVLMAGLLTMSIERALELSREQRARRFAERELEIGRRIQSDFFPTEIPEPRGYELVHHFQAARHVSGDFYDVFWLDNHPARMGIVVADVCDKGVGAALFMALIRTLIRVLSGEINVLKAADSPKADQRPRKLLRTVLRAINDYLVVTHSHAGMFVTLFYGVLQPDTGEFHYANAGHEPPLLISESGQVKSLPPTAPAIGLDAAVAFEVRHIRLVPGDTMVIFTDGVTEAQDRAGTLFTRGRLEALLSTPAVSAADVSARIRKAVEAHMNGQPLSDDVTLLVLRRSAI